MDENNELSLEAEQNENTELPVPSNAALKEEPAAVSHAPHMNTPLPKQKKFRGVLIALLVAIVLAIPLICGVLGAIGFVNIVRSEVSTSGDTPTIGIAPDFDFDSVAPSREDDSLSVRVAAKALPSVVSIQVRGEAQVNPYTGESMQASSSGSGVVIDSQGYILTNNHVIAAGSSYMVNTGSESLEAQLVGADPTTDLAVLKVESTQLPSIQVGSSKDLKLGQYVMAVGSPFGLENSVSTGIISGLGRNSTVQSSNAQVAFIDLIQTDAAINPGNSGGALVNSQAELIGINTLIQSTSGSSAGVGFAIPVDSAILIARQLIDTGRASHPFLGVSTQTINTNIASMYNLPKDSGAYVIRVLDGSPAAKAGITTGDIIVKIEDTEITTSEEVFSAVRTSAVGDTITIVFYRNGVERSVTATLSSDDAGQVPQQQNYHQSQ